ncbi:MAG TPA: hypothetical protein VF220_01490 [Nitrososphaeraceae archaeon]
MSYTEGVRHQEMIKAIKELTFEIRLLRNFLAGSKPDFKKGLFLKS